MSSFLLRTFGALHRWLQSSLPAAYPAWSDGVEGSLCAGSGRARFSAPPRRTSVYAREPSMPHLLTSSRSTTCCGVERNGHCCGFRRSSACNCTITIRRQLAWPRRRQPVSRWSVVGLWSIRRCVPSRTKVDPRRKLLELAAIVGEPHVQDPAR